MKKYLLLLCTVITAFTVRGEFNRLVFHTIEGNEQSIGLTDLNISFTDGEMVAISKGELVKISLSSLKSMEFCNDYSGIIDFLAVKEFEGKVSVYNTDGHLYGIFESVTLAYNKLPSGVYIFMVENGLTSKIKINR